MDPKAAAWFRESTSEAAQWSTADLLEAKGEQRISVVIPARNEEATVADVVSRIRRRLMVDLPLVDELVVMDSLSTDATGERAQAAGAQVWSVADVLAEVGVRPGKGEALWKSLFVTSGDVLLFIDADLTDWDTHFVTGLLGPMLTRPEVRLVKGFYDRRLDLGDGVAAEGGRVTELVARPWLALHRPELSAVVQPLAGEWAIRRDHFASLSVPCGYGVELATLLDTHERDGLRAIAQVDLGQRAHVHQSIHDLSAMATEIMAVAERRTGRQAPDSVALPLIQRDRTWHVREVATSERPPAMTVPGYRANPPVTGANAPDWEPRAPMG
ncbi:glucosyl-3-phosphoglycerate synthase [Nocardioides sp. AN3]